MYVSFPLIRVSRQKNSRPTIPILHPPHRNQAKRRILSPNKPNSQALRDLIQHRPHPLAVFLQRQLARMIDPRPPHLVNVFPKRRVLFVGHDDDALHLGISRLPDFISNPVDLFVEFGEGYQALVCRPTIVTLVLKIAAAYMNGDKLSRGKLIKGSKKKKGMSY